MAGALLIDRYAPADVFARVPELAGQTDPVLRPLDWLLEDEGLYRLVWSDLGRRYPGTLCPGRDSTLGEVLLRRLLVKHL